MKKYLKHIGFSALVLIVLIVVIIKYRQKNRSGLKLIDWNTGNSKIVKFSIDGKTVSQNIDSLKPTQFIINEDVKIKNEDNETYTLYYKEKVFTISSGKIIKFEISMVKE